MGLRFYFLRFWLVIIKRLAHSLLKIIFIEKYLKLTKDGRRLFEAFDFQ